MGAAMPERIETERLVLRVPAPEDARAISTVIGRNREHLARFLPWAAHEPLSDRQRREAISREVEAFASGHAFSYGIFEARTGRYAGAATLEGRGTERRMELAYWIAAEREGRGYVTEAVEAVTLVALTRGVASALTIRHVPGNARSRGVPQRCGYRYAGRADALHSDGTSGEAADTWIADQATLAVAPLALAPFPHVVDGPPGEPLPP